MVFSTTASSLSLTGALLACLLSGCGSLSGSYPRGHALIPDAAIQLTPARALSLEKLAGVGVAATLIHVVYDPLAPNWEIEEAVYPEGVYQLAMRAKRFRTGGSGEALMILKRRAQQLQREAGAQSYQILEFVEGIDSGTPVAQQFAEASIQLVRSPSQAPQAPASR